jgi:hypothetical protein
MSEVKFAWVLHSAMFYYSVRKHIFKLPVFENHSAFIERAVDLFLSGAGPACRRGRQRLICTPSTPDYRLQDNQTAGSNRAAQSSTTATISTSIRKPGLDSAVTPMSVLGDGRAGFHGSGSVLSFIPS